MQFLLDLLGEFGAIDLTLVLKIKPRHAGCHRTIANLLDHILDLFQELGHIGSLLHFGVLVLLLAFVVHSQVSVTSIDKICLDIEVEVVQIVLFTVDQVRLVINEVILLVEKFLVLMMQVQ